MPDISHSGQALKVLACQHQEAIWAVHQTTSRPRSVLLELYPQALQAFPNLKHKAALTILVAASTPEFDAKMTARKIVALLHRCGRRNDVRLVPQILGDLKTPAVRQPMDVVLALGHIVIALLGIITAMHAATLVESGRMEVNDGPGLHLHTQEDETFIVLEERYRSSFPAAAPAASVEITWPRHCLARSTTSNAAAPHAASTS